MLINRVFSAPWWSAVIAGLVCACLLYLGVGLSFRFSGYGEGLYDLHYVAGGWLQQGWPTPELWAPGGVVTRYYNFGLAAWGWLGANLNWTLGATYVLGLILLPALVFGLSYAMLGGAWWLRGMASLVATFPATGLSVVVGTGLIAVPEHVRSMAHVRLPEWVDRNDGTWVAETLVTGQAYPVESLTHLILELQNLHPPVLGFALLYLVLLWAWRTPANAPAADVAAPRRAAAVREGVWLGALLPLGYAVNAWMLPLLCGTLLGLLILRGRLWVWPGAALGAALMYALLWWPFFREFDPPQAVSVRWLTAAERSTGGAWWLIWWPQMLAMLWLIRSTIWQRTSPVAHWRQTLGLPLLFFLAVLSLEFVLLDDAYGGAYERFNSVLKTGSLALAAWTASLLIAATRSGRARVIWPVLILLAVPSLLQIKDTLPKLRGPAEQAPNWRLDQTAMLPQAEQRAIFDRLRREPRGITLEFPLPEAYALTPVISTLAAFPTWSGWVAHLDQIGAYPKEGRAAREALLRWYQVYPPDNRALDRYQVDYILVDSALRWGDAAIRERRDALGAAWEWVPAMQNARGDWAGYFRRAGSENADILAPARAG